MTTPETHAIRLGHYLGTAQRSIDAAVLATYLARLGTAGLAEHPSARRSATRHVFQVPVAPRDQARLGGGAEMYLKRYDVTSLPAWLKTLLGVHNAQKSWRVGRALRSRGLATPQPLFLLFRRHRLGRGEHLLATEGVTGGLGLREYVHRHFTTPAADRSAQLGTKRAFVRAVAAFIARLHLTHVYHGDLTAANILVRPIGADAHPTAWQLSLIDLDAVRTTRWISKRRRLKNLDELGRNFLDLRVITTADRARFLQHFLRVNTDDTCSFRELFVAVQRRTQQRLRTLQQQYVVS